MVIRSKRLNFTFNDHDFLLLQLALQLIFESSQKPTSGCGATGKHAVNHNFVTIGNIPHPPKPFVGQWKESQSLKLLK